MTPTEPTAGHRWLEQLVGEWTFESASGTEDKCAGIERVRKLGDLWVLGESEMSMPGGAVARSIITIGYDPHQKRYIGTWVGSMMATLWVYDGELDPTGRILSLYAEGPGLDENGNFSPTKRGRYRDAIEFHDDGTRTFSGSMQQPDGSWQTFMTLKHTRKS